ncbi:hypothetical protein [Thioalkalivibrio sp. ALE19]|uniref:hypothetical protein n=1 Tax=Thioalkalivibrio sp. ALE19 TaxID=1266909 RepID=UPI00041EA14D|nr:hypothetical protein [Thioalkalivibrio sp. ALE19]
MKDWEMEYGVIRIPKREWPALKRAVVEEHRAFRERALTLSKKIHAELKTFRNADELPGRRSFPEHIEHEVMDQVGAGLERAVQLAAMLLLDWRDTWTMPGAPTRKRLEEVPMTRDQRINETLIRMDLGWGARLELNGRQPEVIWEIPEGEDLIKDVHAHPVAAGLFLALDAVRWTGDTGGLIKGNDKAHSNAGFEDYGKWYWGTDPECRHLFGSPRENRQPTVF